MSYIPRAKQKGELMLNLGVRNYSAPKTVALEAGFEHVGVDINDSPLVDVLADAHALPFADESFGLVLAFSALQYFQHTAVAAREIWRVLKPGGLFIGSVPFLEPYCDSCYRYTHTGLISMLQTAGFSPRRVSASKHWDGLRAQATMHLFPKMPRLLSNALLAPIRALHRAWWAVGGLVTRHPSATEENRILYGTGAFDFIATKKPPSA